MSQLEPSKGAGRSRMSFFDRHWGRESVQEEALLVLERGVGVEE